MFKRFLTSRVWMPIYWSTHPTHGPLARRSLLAAGLCVTSATLLGGLALGDPGPASTQSAATLPATLAAVRAAASEGRTIAEFRLGTLLDPSSGDRKGSSAKSWTKANYWYHKAAAQGDAAAQVRLARDYANGYGFKRNYEKAVYWYRKAAHQGNAYAQVNLAIAYANGISIKRNARKVVYWFRKAAEQGNSIAQNNLGVAYDLGRGVPKDHEAAVRWFRRAAKQGDARAEFNLANAYWLGQGVKRDGKAARRWYRKAAADGNMAARRQLERLEAVK